MKTPARFFRCGAMGVIILCWKASGRKFLADIEWMKRVRLFNVVKKNLASVCPLLGMFFAIFCLGSAPSFAGANDDKAKQAKPAKSKTRKQSGSPYGSHTSSGSGLAQEWAATNELKAYKQNYFMAFSHLSQPNVLPTSPNPTNQVTTPYDIQNKEVKFQISLKHILADYEQAGTLWLGYTQLSFWQVYNQATSQPFREIDYEPELIYSLRPNDSSILNFGAVHQSIGQTNPSERSWNRVYIEPGMQFRPYSNSAR